MSDQYCVVRILDKEMKTSVKSNCSNGIWNQSLIFNEMSFDINNQSSWPVMLVTIMDEDISNDELLGYTYVWLSDSAYLINDTENLRPKWHQLYLEKSNKAQG